MFIKVIIKSINRITIYLALIILVGSLTSQIQAHTCSFSDRSSLHISLSDSQTFHDNTKHFWRTLPMQNKDKDYCFSVPDPQSKLQRRIDYVTSARTALSLVLGKGHLFATRSGLPLDELFQGRYILPCHFMNTHQCRYLGFHLFNYQHYASRGKSETTHLKNLILVDDSSKFISKPDSIFGSGSRISPWLHILSVLRSSGTGMLFLDQTVQTIWSDVKQLCHIWLVVGGIQGRGNQDEVASAMSLNQAQKEMLGRLQTRECIFFCPRFLNILSARPPRHTLHCHN